MSGGWGVEWLCRNQAIAIDISHPRPGDANEGRGGDVGGGYEEGRKGKQVVQTVESSFSRFLAVNTETFSTRLQSLSSHTPLLFPFWRKGP